MLALGALLLLPGLGAHPLVDPTEAREIVRDMKKQARAFGKMYGVKGC